MDIILVEPEIAGNIGAVARSMKNFGFTKLILVNPQCDHKSSETICRAKNAQDVLKKAKVITSLDKLKYDYRIGTSGKLGSDYNIMRSPTTPKELAKSIAALKRDAKIALCFGRESSGLTNEELATMDFLVHIPADDAYPVLNLSHAVTIILYELYTHTSDDILERYKPMQQKDKNVILDLTDDILDRLHFAMPSKKETQKLLWKKMVGKSFLTRREGFALMGFLRKVLKKMKE